MDLYSFLPIGASFRETALDIGNNFLPFGSIIFYAWWHIEAMVFQNVLWSPIQKASIEGDDHLLGCD